MLGRPVAKALADAGFIVTALSRNPNDLKGSLPANLRWVKGDLRNIHELEAVIRGQDAIHLNLSVRQNERRSDFHTEGEGLSNLLKVAAHSSVRRISYLSSLIQFYPSDWWVLELKRKAVQQVKRAPIPHYIFYPSNFMESIPNQYQFGNLLINLGQPRYPLHWIASRDYAAQVVAAYVLGTEESDEFVVQGPEAIPVQDALARYAAASPKGKLLLINLPIWPAQLAGRFISIADYGAQVIEAINNYPERFAATHTWKVLGKPTTTLEEFAALMG